MKTICRMISVVLILMFVFSLTSCSENEEIVPEKKAYKVKLNSWQTHLKKGDNDGDQHVIIPKLVGSVVDQSGVPISRADVELRVIPDNLLVDETFTNYEGTFEFENIEIASYEIVIRQNGKIISKEVLDLL